MNPKGPLDWIRLRGDIGDAQRSATDADELQSVRARLFNAAANDGATAAATRKRRLPLGALALAACLALGVGIFARLYSDRPLSFETGTARNAGAVGAALLAQPAEPMPVRFSDGSTFTMTSATRARVADTNAHGGTVVLENGSIDAAVVHRPAGHWRVVAGPFTVLVTGTKFDVHWSVAEQTFALKLHEGSVSVLGPSLPDGTGRRVSPGEELRISVERAPVAEKNADVAAPIVDRGHSDAVRAPSPPEKLEVAKRVPWRQLALDAHYAEALSAAETDNFQALCRRESSRDLLLLGDTAHFAGSIDRAEQAFRSVRGRFPGGHEAAVAAFSLGRIAYDERRNFGGSADWFQTYLREEPAGTLAREASGRLIEAYRAAGNLAAARDAAATYLAAYPAGPHAALARSISNR
jgi:hypothetical protein